MFSVSTSVVLLVFFVSQALGLNSSTVSLNVSPGPSSTVVVANPTSSALSINPTASTSEGPITSPSEKALGQNSSAVSLNVSPSSSSVVVLSSSVSNLTSSAAPTEFTTKTSEQPTTSPSIKTCAKLGVVIDKPWNDTYKNRTSGNFLTLKSTFSSALKKVYSDSENYINVEVSEVHFTEKEDKVLAEANLSLVFKGRDKVFIEDVFKKEVETGELGGSLPVIKNSAEFDPLGVSWKDWKAKDGECEEKCGTGGPFLIVRECQDATCSCKGHKTKTKETKECTTYCSSTVAVSVSSVILLIGMFLSSSFQ